MIINRSLNFCFIHIPKCAGTTARKVLADYNEWEHAGPPWVRRHSSLGNIDYGHLPLFTLRDFFKANFEEVKAMNSFAIIRDPYERFASSVSQRLKMYYSKSIFEIGPKEFREAIQRDIDFLSKQPKFEHLLPVEYAHFQKQIDYLYLGKDKIIDSIYSVEDLEKLFNNVEKITGASLDFKPQKKSSVINEGQTRVIKNDTLMWLIKLAKLLNLNKIISGDLKHKLIHPISVPRNERMQSLFSDPAIHDFINNYYSDDIALFKVLKTQSSTII